MNENDLQNLQFLYSQIQNTSDEKLLQKVKEIEREIINIRDDVNNNRITIIEANKRIDNILIDIGGLKNRLLTVEDTIKELKIDKVEKWIKELEDLGLNPEVLGKQYNYYLDLQDVKKLFKMTTEILEEEDDPYDLGMLEFEGTTLNDLLLVGDKLLKEKFQFKTKELIWQTNRRVQGGIMQIDIRSSKETNNQENVIYLNMNNLIQITIKEDKLNSKYIYTVESRPELSSVNVTYTAEAPMDSVKNVRNKYQFNNQDVHVLNFEYEATEDVYIIRGIQINIDITKTPLYVNFTYIEMFKLNGKLFNDFLLNLPFGISINTTLNKSTDTDLSSFSQILRGYSILRLGDLINVIYDTTENELEENKLFGLYGISSIVSISKLADAVKGTVHATAVKYTNKTSWVNDLYAYVEELDDFSFGPNNVYRNVLPYADTYPINTFYKSTYIYEMSGHNTRVPPLRCDDNGKIDKLQQRRIAKPWIRLQPNQLQSMRFANPSGGKLLTEYTIPGARLDILKGTMIKTQEDDNSVKLEVDYFLERRVSNFKENKVHGPVTIVVTDINTDAKRIIDCDLDRIGLQASGALISTYADNIDSYGYVVIAKNPSQTDFDWVRKVGNKIDIVFGVVIEGTVSYDDYIIIEQGNGTGQAEITNPSFEVQYQKNANAAKVVSPVLKQQLLNFGEYQRPCYYGILEHTVNEECIMVSGRVIRMRSKNREKDVIKPVCKQAGSGDGRDWIKDCIPKYYCGKGISQGGDAMKFEIGPLTEYMIVRIGTDDRGDGTPGAVDMMPGNRDRGKPMLYYSNYETYLEKMMFDESGSNYISNGWFSFSTEVDYGWHQCPDDGGYGYFRWGPRWRSTRVTPLQNTTTNDLVITIPLDPRITTAMYEIDADSPDKLIVRNTPTKIKGVDTKTKLGPYRIKADYKEGDEMMPYWSWKWNIVPGNDIVDGTKPLTLITYKKDQYKIIKVDLTNKTEIVLPSTVITQTELSEDSVRQWNSIDLIRQYTTYLKTLVDNQSLRLKYVEEAVEVINTRIDNIITQLSPKQNSFSIAKTITGFLGTTIGMFFPLTGLLFQIGTALIDTVEHIENEDLLYGALDIVLVSMMTVLGIKKFKVNIREKYGIGAFDAATDYTIIKLKNSYLKLGQTIRTQYSKIGQSLSKLRWKSSGYNTFGSTGKYTINSKPRSKYYSFWTRTTSVKYTKLTNEPELDVETHLHSPATNRNGKIVNWLKARDEDWKNILNGTVKNGRTTAPIFRATLKHHVLAKDGDATVVKMGNEGYFMYKINGKTRKYPIDVDKSVSDFTLIKDKTMTMNDWIELMHMYSGLGRTSAIASLDSELMDAIILSARRPVGPDAKKKIVYNMDIKMDAQVFSIMDNTTENIITNLPSVNYDDIMKMLDVGIQSRTCTINVISALLSPDSGDAE